MYLFPAPPPPPRQNFAKHFFCPLGTAISRTNPGNNSYAILGGSGGWWVGNKVHYCNVLGFHVFRTQI